MSDGQYHRVVSEMKSKKDSDVDLTRRARLILWTSVFISGVVVIVSVVVLNNLQTTVQAQKQTAPAAPAKK
jgi:hypothetical protein